MKYAHVFVYISQYMIPVEIVMQSYREIYSVDNVSEFKGRKPTFHTNLLCAHYRLMQFIPIMFGSNK